MSGLVDPVAVFDAGIGSYAVVAEIQRQFPRQDILYFADRASFPYGAKCRDELLEIMRRTIAFLETYEPSAIVMASNAPSIMALDEARQFARTPLHGVFPPVGEALALSRSGRIGVMGVRSLIHSAEFAGFVARQGAAPGAITGIKASAMVELVESGAFLFEPEATQAAVDRFAAAIVAEHPEIDVLTLSSTHLPWLRRFFEAALPDCRFLDPAQKIVAGLAAPNNGSGAVLGLATEDETYDLATFRRMLARIGVEIPLQSVRID